MPDVTQLVRQRAGIQPQVSWPGKPIIAMTTQGLPGLWGIPSSDCADFTHQLSCLAVPKFSLL